jgi:hypothetical protein
MLKDTSLIKHIIEQQEELSKSKDPRDTAQYKLNKLLVAHAAKAELKRIDSIIHSILFP